MYGDPDKQATQNFCFVSGNETSLHTSSMLVHAKTLHIDVIDMFFWHFSWSSDLHSMMLASARFLIAPTGKHVLKIENKSDKVISVSIGQRLLTLFSARTFENVL